MAHTSSTAGNVGEPLARLREREGPAAERWEGKGRRPPTQRPPYYIDFIKYYEILPEKAGNRRKSSTRRATLTLPTLRAGPLPLPQAVEGLTMSISNSRLRRVKHAAPACDPFRTELE